MGLSVDRNYGAVKNAAISVFLQVLSTMFSIIGIIQMRKAYTAAGVAMDEAADLVPWETALVVFYCFCVTAVDVSLLRFITQVDTAARTTFWGGGLALLHFFLWFCAVFFAMAVLTLTVGFVILGLGKSEMLQESDSDIFYGLSPSDIMALTSQADLYMNGAWMLVFGTFLSIPPQGWLISAAAVKVSSNLARETTYKPAGSPKWAKQTTPAVYYKSGGKKVSTNPSGETDPLFQPSAYEAF